MPAVPPSTPARPVQPRRRATPAHADIDSPEHAGHYQALVARDARFDGRLFVGVSSTGVYCRPVCRVRTPKAAHCRFFTSAAQAEAASYRPCLKCRPELAPGPGGAWTVMDASRQLAHQAAALLDAQGPDGPAAGTAALAARLGISERHLRRIFLAEHGVTPLQYLQTRRLLLAKQLLTDTPLPITQVALASGWHSLRRFNAVFAERYRMSPSRLRTARGEPARRDAEPAIELQLGYRPPFDRARLLAFLAQRAIPGVEQVGAEGLRRTLRAGALGDAAMPAGWVAVQFAPGAPVLRLNLAPSLLPHSAALVAAVRRWLDLDAQPAVIDAALRELPGAPGLRLPGALDAFELAVRAVLGQQVTVAAARTLATRLVDHLGTPLVTPWAEVHRAFPSPQALAAAPVDAVAALGIIRSRAGALVALGAAWPGLKTLLHPAADPQALIERLCTLPGIGPWTAHYIAMRALGWPDAFPPGDVAVLKALRGGGQGGGAITAPRQPDRSATLPTAIREAEAASQRWRPWRSYAVLKLWDQVAPAPAAAPASTPDAAPLISSTP